MIDKFEFEGKEIEVRMPTINDNIEARLFSGGIFRKATEQEIPPPARDQLSKHLIKIGMWNEEKENKLNELGKLIDEGTSQLARGGKTKDGEVFTKSDARKLAIDMMKWRNEWISLALQLHKYDHLSLEGIVEEANFNFLVSCCSYSNGERLYKSYDDFIEKQNTELAFRCSEILSKKMFGESDNKNPETDFLKKYNFMDNEGRFINNEGKFTDSEGRLVDSEGRYIDESGNYINRGGEKVDKEGNPIVEFTEFAE